MKKYICIVSMLFVVACAGRVNKTEFINPIFYQPLEPLSADGYVYITPTSIDMRTPKDKNLVAGFGTCKLTENTQKQITLRCKYKWIPKEGELAFFQELLKSPDATRREIAQSSLQNFENTYESDFIYTVKEFFDDCLRIQENTIDMGEDHPSSIMNYCVTPPDKLKSD